MFKSRIHIDFSDNGQYEETLESLLRVIFRKPVDQKPELGSPPTYLTEDSRSFASVERLRRVALYNIKSHPERIDGSLTDFFLEFNSRLKDLKITFPPAIRLFDAGRLIVESVHTYMPLRNEYVMVVDELAKSGVSFDIDTLIEFFSEASFFVSARNMEVNGDLEVANFKIFIHELFLLTIAIGVKCQHFQFINSMLLSLYMVKDGPWSREMRPFFSFYGNTDYIDEYINQTRGEETRFAVGDLILGRIPAKLTRNHIVQADLLCHYILEIRWDYFRLHTRYAYRGWYPLTHPAWQEERLELFDKMISKRYFDKIKILFLVETVQELKALMKTIRERNGGKETGLSRIDAQMPFVYELIDLTTIGTAI